MKENILLMLKILAINYGKTDMEYMYTKKAKASTDLKKEALEMVIDE